MTDFEINMLIIGGCALVVAFVGLTCAALAWRNQARSWRKYANRWDEAHSSQFARAQLFKRFVVGYFQARDDEKPDLMDSHETQLARLCDKERPVTKVDWS